MNVKELTRKLRTDPLDDLIACLRVKHQPANRHIIAYQMAYKHYALAAERMVLETSIARRFWNGAYYARKYGEAYTPAQRKIAKKFNPIAPYIEHDFFTLIIFSRILLDRTIGMARFFLPQKARPSFVSFNDHRRFYIAKRIAGITDTAYGAFIRGDTEWLHDSLKRFRDRAIVHNERAPYVVLGQAHKRKDVSVIYLLPEDFVQSENPGGNWKKMDLLELLDHVRDFLRSYNRHGVRCLLGDPQL